MEIIIKRDNKTKETSFSIKKEPAEIVSNMDILDSFIMSSGAYLLNNFKDEESLKVSLEQFSNALIGYTMECFRLNNRDDKKANFRVVK